MCWQNKRFYWEGAPRQEPRRTALPCGSFGFYGDGISFRVVLNQSFWLRVFPGGARLVKPRWMPERRILGDGQTCGDSFWHFPNSSSWWWLISSMFLTRTSCHKATHANGYCGAWPGWAVSISVLPLTEPYWNIAWNGQSNILQLSRKFLKILIWIQHWNALPSSRKYAMLWLMKTE